MKALHTYLTDLRATTVLTLPFSTVMLAKVRVLGIAALPAPDPKCLSDVCFQCREQKPALKRLKKQTGAMLETDLRFFLPCWQNDAGKHSLQPCLRRSWMQKLRDCCRRKNQHTRGCGDIRSRPAEHGARYAHECGQLYGRVACMCGCRALSEGAALWACSVHARVPGTL